MISQISNYDLSLYCFFLSASKIFCLGFIFFLPRSLILSSYIKNSFNWLLYKCSALKQVMKNVKILYVRNLMLTTSEEHLSEVFVKAAGCTPDDIERVKKIKDFAFVHFSQRDLALRAMEKLDGTKIDGSLVEVTLAKPVDKTSHYYNKMTRVNQFQKLPPSVRYFNQMCHQHNLYPVPTAHHLNPFMTGAPPHPHHHQMKAMHHHHHGGHHGHNNHNGSGHNNHNRHGHMQNAPGPAAQNLDPLPSAMYYGAMPQNLCVEIVILTFSAALMLFFWAVMIRPSNQGLRVWGNSKSY